MDRINVRLDPQLKEQLESVARAEGVEPVGVGAGRLEGASLSDRENIRAVFTLDRRDFSIIRLILEIS